MKMSRTAQNVQRDFALSSGLRSEIIWDSLSPEQSDVLKHKIETLLPEVEGKNVNELEKQRKLLFNNVWAQRRYTNRTLLSTIIYVLVTEERDTTRALQATNFTCHPVFRTRKCMKDDNSAGCCMIFIDEYGRHYSNWAQFVSKNALPKGTMIAPAQGVYNFNELEEVLLEVHVTASAGVKSKILNAGDTIAKVGGLVATVPVAAALAVPVAGPVMIAATVLGAATAAYSTVRSATTLFDRRRHGQPTALTDREARGNWLGVAGGVVGLGATGATKVLSCATAAGQEVSAATRLAVRGINVSSIVLSGSGVANSAYHLYTKVSDDQNLSGLDVLQLASSLMIFTHSINNLRIASKIISGDSGSTVRRVLHNRTRKIFDQISSETLKLHSSGSGNKFDMIRTLNDIPFKEVLLSLHKVHEHLNAGASIVTAIGATILPNVVSAGVSGGMELNLPMLAATYGPQLVQHITSMGNFVDVLETLTKYFCEHSVQFLMELARRFIERSSERIELSLSTFVSTEMVLYHMLLHCIKNYKDFSYQYLEQQSTKILTAIEMYFESLNPINAHSRRHKCSVCKGNFYVCNL